MPAGEVERERRMVACSHRYPVVEVVGENHTGKVPVREYRCLICGPYTAEIGSGGEDHHLLSFYLGDSETPRRPLRRAA